MGKTDYRGLVRMLRDVERAYPWAKDAADAIDQLSDSLDHMCDRHQKLAAHTYYVEERLEKAEEMLKGKHDDYDFAIMVATLQAFPLASPGSSRVWDLDRGTAEKIAREILRRLRRSISATADGKPNDP